MAHTKSSKKRVRINERNTIRNKSRRSKLKTCVKKVESAIENKDLDLAKTTLQNVYKELDKAASKKIIHKNAASRKKSRLAAKYNSIAAK